MSIEKDFPIGTKVKPIAWSIYHMSVPSEGVVLEHSKDMFDPSFDQLKIEWDIGVITYHFSREIQIVNSSIPCKQSTLSPSLPSKNGMNCKKCKFHNPYAEPNQSDGSYICYSCR